MLSSEVADEDLARVPRLASSCDPTVLSLSPAEGFLLSRIDGQTSWKLLREIGGLTGQQVDQCIEEWLAQGLIDIDGRPPRVQRRKERVPDPPQKPSCAAVGAIDESLIDPALDIDEETQRAILGFEQNLDLDYFEILGVASNADTKEIKRAYFGLSKRFHPDRFFRRNLGTYGARLEKIFKCVSEAYELLHDPTSRKEVERTIAEARPVQPRSPANDSGSAEPPRPMTPIERLRQRMPFRIPKKARKEKSAKGEELFKAAQLADRMGRLAEAASNMRLAVAFDPFNREYKRALGEIQAKAAMARIEELVGEPEGNWVDSDKAEAKRLVEGALLYRSHDATANDLAARLYLCVGDCERAAEYAERALEVAPETGAYHRTMGKVHRKRGNKGHAISELERSIELDPGDVEARQILDALKMTTRRSLANGG